MGVSRTRCIFIIQGKANLGSDGSEQNPQGEAVPSVPHKQERQESCDSRQEAWECRNGNAGMYRARKT
jgi:hypothetical protein